MNVNQNLITAIVTEFKNYTAIEKAVLFGSRARGDNSERSDYDIAVYGTLSSDEKFTLRYRIREELPTLHKIDLIFMCEDKPAAFKENIEKEGIAIYEAKN